MYEIFYNWIYMCIMIIKIKKFLLNYKNSEKKFKFCKQDIKRRKKFEHLSPNNTPTHNQLTPK